MTLVGMHVGMGHANISCRNPGGGLAHVWQISLAMCFRFPGPAINGQKFPGANTRRTSLPSGPVGPWHSSRRRCQSCQGCGTCALARCLRRSLGRRWWRVHHGFSASKHVDFHGETTWWKTRIKTRSEIMKLGQIGQKNIRHDQTWRFEYHSSGTRANIIWVNQLMKLFDFCIRWGYVPGTTFPIPCRVAEICHVECRYLDLVDVTWCQLTFRCENILYAIAGCILHSFFNCTRVKHLSHTHVVSGCVMSCFTVLNVYIYIIYYLFKCMLCSIDFHYAMLGHGIEYSK